GWLSGSGCVYGQPILWGSRGFLSIPSSRCAGGTSASPRTSATDRGREGTSHDYDHNIRPIGTHPEFAANSDGPWTIWLKERPHKFLCESPRAANYHTNHV